MGRVVAQLVTKTTSCYTQERTLRSPYAGNSGAGKKLLINQLKQPKPMLILPPSLLISLPLLLSFCTSGSFVLRHIRWPNEIPTEPEFPHVTRGWGPNAWEAVLWLIVSCKLSCCMAVRAITAYFIGYSIQVLVNKPNFGKTRSIRSRSKTLH